MYRRGRKKLLLHPKMDQAILCTAAKGYTRLYPKNSKIIGFNIRKKYADSWSSVCEIKIPLTSEKF